MTKNNKYIRCKADVKFNSHLVFIYYNRTEIAKHQILPAHMANGMRTEQAHLPFPLRENLSADAMREGARETGPKTFEAIRRMFGEAKGEEQPMQTAKAILSISDIYSPEVLERACDKALRQYHMPYYKTIYFHAESINSAKERTGFKENNRKTGIIRGADYYRKIQMNIEIKKSLSILELGGPARIIEMQEKDIKLVDLSCEKRLELLLETLIQERENRLINRLIRNAYFKYPSASLESLDYDSRQIKKSTILNLATMGFIANATNLVITGPAGTGKTYLACALGVEACRQAYRVLPDAQLRKPGRQSSGTGKIQEKDRQLSDSYP